MQVFKIVFKHLIMWNLEKIAVAFMKVEKRKIVLINKIKNKVLFIQ